MDKWKGVRSSPPLWAWTGRGRTGHWVVFGAHGTALHAGGHVREGSTIRSGDAHAHPWTVKGPGCSRGGCCRRRPLHTNVGVSAGDLPIW